MNKSALALCLGGALFSQYSLSQVNTPATIQAEAYSHMNGIQLEATSDTSGCAWGMITNSNNGGGISNLNMSTAQIESWFRQFSTQPLVRNESIAYWVNWKAQTGQRIDAEMHRLFYYGLTRMVLR